MYKMYLGFGSVRHARPIGSVAQHALFKTCCVMLGPDLTLVVVE
jgi:hypothetical protein